MHCPYHRCSRTGLNGFTWSDDLTEHIRGYHKKHISKRRPHSTSYPSRGTLSTQAPGMPSVPDARPRCPDSKTDQKERHYCPNNDCKGHIETTHEIELVDGP